MSRTTGNGNAGNMSNADRPGNKPRQKNRASSNAETETNDTDFLTDLREFNASMGTLKENLEQIRDRLVLMNKIMVDRRHSDYAAQTGIDSKMVH